MCNLKKEKEAPILLVRSLSKDGGRWYRKHTTTSFSLYFSTQITFVENSISRRIRLHRTNLMGCSYPMSLWGLNKNVNSLLKWRFCCCPRCTALASSLQSLLSPRPPPPPHLSPFSFCTCSEFCTTMVRKKRVYRKPGDGLLRKLTRANFAQNCSLREVLMLQGLKH